MCKILASLWVLLLLAFVSPFFFILFLVLFYFFLCSCFSYNLINRSCNLLIEFISSKIYLVIIYFIFSSFYIVWKQMRCRITRRLQLLRLLFPFLVRLSPFRPPLLPTNMGILCKLPHLGAPCENFGFRFRNSRKATNRIESNCEFGFADVVFGFESFEFCEGFVVLCS